MRVTKREKPISKGRLLCDLLEEHSSNNNGKLTLASECGGDELVEHGGLFRQRQFSVEEYDG